MNSFGLGRHAGLVVFALIALAHVRTASAQLLPGAKSQSATAFDLSAMTDPVKVIEQLEKFRAANDVPKQIDAVKRALELRPYAGGLRFELARLYALQNDKTGSYDTLINLQQQGYNFDPSGNKDFKNIEDTEVYRYIVKNLKENGKPYGDGRVAFNIQNDQPMLESFALDAKTGKFYTASARTGEIFSMDAAGKTTLFAKPDAVNGLYGVFAIAIDSARNRLYAGSTSLKSYVKFDAASYGQSGLFQFELSTGKLLNKYVAIDGQAHVFSALTVAPTGEVYAADPGTRAVFQLRNDVFRQLFQVADMVNLRGIAVSDNHKFLYMSDFELGIFVADLEKNEIRQIDKKPQNLGGIDGLYFWNNHLVALQSGFSPARVMRIALNPDLKSIRLVQPLESNKKALTVPTFGGLKGSQLYFIANSQRDAYDSTGKLAGARAARPSVYVVDAKYRLGQELKLPDWAPKPK